jgi:TrmH family RNA methyltransferase
MARGDEARLLLDGWHLLDEALAAALVLETVLVDVNVADAHAATLDRCSAAGARVVTATAPVLAAASPVQTSTGVVAIGQRPDVALPHLLSPAPALVLAAFGLQDPGNAGALIRSAAAAGATGVLPPRRTPIPGRPCARQWARRCACPCDATPTLTLS